jgi:thioredoxin 1
LCRIGHSPVTDQLQTRRIARVSGNIVHTTDATFESDVLKSETPVLLDFWAEWCGPCKAIAPILDDIAKDYAGRVKVAKLNIDDNRHTPVKYGVRGIPTLILFKSGQVAGTKVGAVPKGALVEWVESVL